MIVNDPVRHAVMARMLFELGYITELSKTTMLDLNRRVEAARERGHMKPGTGRGASFYQLTDERAALLSRAYNSRTGETGAEGVHPHRTVLHRTAGGNELAVSPLTLEEVLAR